MMATRQLLGAARSRAIGSASLGLRRMATVSDSPLDKKVSPELAATR
jgi:aconitate hydratase